MTRPVRLSFRVELARQWGQRRIRITLTILAVLPIVVRSALLLGGPPPTSTAGATDIVALAQSTGATFAAFVLILTSGFLVTLVAALLFGDLVAGEASRSTLKYLLTVPVPRLRLLAVKVQVASALLVAALLALTLVSLVVGVLSYGAEGIQVLGGPRLAFGDSVDRLLLTTIAAAVGLLWAAALGTLLSVVTDSPLAAAGGVVLVAILSTILDQIPALGDLRVVLPTHWSSTFRSFLTTPVDYGPPAEALLSGLIWAVVLGTLAAWRLVRKDVSG